MAPEDVPNPVDQAATRPRPSLVIFDVNETLSDMSPMARRFEDEDLPMHLAATWFAGLLRDGFALTVTGANPSFAALAAESLKVLLHGVTPDVDAATTRIMSGFAKLPLHADVADGIRTLRALNVPLVTLSNGASAVAQSLLERNGLQHAFDRLLSVQEAPAWKPAASAYRYALQTCQVPAASAMLVAVHPWDIHGAHQAGLQTAWINRAGGRYPHSMHPADIEVPSLTALASVLTEARGPAE